MAKSREGCARRAPTSFTRPAIAPWPSALDIPQRITSWSEMSGHLDRRANDDISSHAIETLYSIGDVQERWGVSDTTLYREIRAGKLRASKVGGQWRVPESAMVDYLKSNEPPLRLPGHPPRSRRSP